VFAVSCCAAQATERRLYGQTVTQLQRSGSGLAAALAQPQTLQQSVEQHQQLQRSGSGRLLVSQAPASPAGVRPQQAPSGSPAARPLGPPGGAGLAAIPPMPLSAERGAVTAGAGASSRAVTSPAKPQLSPSRRS
jgi:hypothetical protein